MALLLPPVLHRDVTGLVHALEQRVPRRHAPAQLRHLIHRQHARSKMRDLRSQVRSGLAVGRSEVREMRSGAQGGSGCQPVRCAEVEGVRSGVGWVLVVRSEVDIWRSGVRSKVRSWAMVLRSQAQGRVVPGPTRLVVVPHGRSGGIKCRSGIRCIEIHAWLQWQAKDGGLQHRACHIPRLRHLPGPCLRLGLLVVVLLVVLLLPLLLVLLLVPPWLWLVVVLRLVQKYRCCYCCPCYCRCPCQV